MSRIILWEHPSRRPKKYVPKQLTIEERREIHRQHELDIAEMKKHDKLRGKEYFDTLKQSLTMEFGPEIGHFLTCRVAKEFRKHKFNCISGFDIIEITYCSNSRLDNLYKLHTCCGWFEADYTFKRLFGLSRRTFRFGICYGH